jgi:hypothetical protein
VSMLRSAGPATEPAASVGAGPRTVARFGDVLGPTRGVFVAFTALTLLATNQLIVLADHTDRFFAWTILGRPTSAFLGAAYAAGFVLSVLALRQRRWRDVRVALLTVTVFTVLTLVPTLLHLHRLHLMDQDVVARTAAWFWLAVYIVIPIACLRVVTRQHQLTRRTEPVRRPLPTWLSWVLGAQGTAMFLAGGALFLVGAGEHHHLPPGALSFWPWPLTPLSAQVIGAWLLALAGAAALVIRERDLSRLLVPAATYTAFGLFELLVLVRYWTQMSPGYPWPWAYVALLGSIALTGAYGCRAARGR